jgi:hypothetical protein
MLSKTKLKYLMNKTNIPIFNILQQLATAGSGWTKEIIQFSENTQCIVYRKDNIKQGSGKIIFTTLDNKEIKIPYNKQDVFWCFFNQQFNDIGRWNFNY